MDWILSNPQIDSMFASLGSMDGDKYVISEQCIVILEEINCKLLMEDHTLRTFRRAIQYGENIKRYLMPLLINGKVASVIDAVIRILVNLTVPIECLVSIEIMSKSEAGRLTIFDLNKLLAASKEAFTEFRSTKSIIDYMKSILEKDSELSFEQCDSVNNCLLLLRNILHIPEITSYNNHGNAKVSMQNQIVWNLFTQSIDKLLVYLMSFSQKTYWGITMVQLIALMYKDQHVSTLQKLLNIWFEASLSDSSDDNESNTTPPKQCSGGSSPMLMSDPTSDSSDTGGSVNHSTEGQMRGLSAGEIDSDSSKMSLDFVTPNLKVNSPTNHRSSKDREHIQPQKMITINTPHQNIAGSCNQKERKRESFSSQSEMSDCGYGTQVENQESISTSSNEDDCPKTKPIHHPPCNQKQRFNAASKHRNSCSIIQDQKEWRRKKIVKRSRSNL